MRLAKGIQLLQKNTLDADLGAQHAQRRVVQFELLGMSGRRSRDSAHRGVRCRGPASLRGADDERDRLRHVAGRVL